MHLLKQNILHRWRNFSLGKEQYEKCMEQAYLGNLKSLRQANIVVFILAIASSLFPLFITNDIPRAGVHFAAAAAALLFNLIARQKFSHTESFSKRLTTLLLLLYYANIMMLGIIIDIWANPEIPAVSFMVGLAVVMLLFVMPSLFHLCLHTIALIVFLLLAYNFKEPHTWAVDTINSLVAYFVGLFFFWKINSYRLSAMATADKERKANEAEMRGLEAEKRTRDLIDVCPLAVSLYDTDWKELACNPAAIKMFGLDETYEFGNPTDAFMQEIQLDGRHRDEVDAELYKSLMEKGHAHIEIICLKADGTPMILDTNYVRLDYSGYSLFASFCRDLTEERAIWERERETNELNEIFVKNSPLIMNIWDESGNIVSSSPQAAKILGIGSEKEFIERFFELSPETQPCGTPSREKAAMYISQTFKEGSLRCNWMHQKLDGELVPTEVILHRFTQDGKPYVASFATDQRLTIAMQEKKANERIQKEQEDLIQKLEAASKAKSRFLSNMSHEIRTPMSAIIGMTSIAKNTDDTIKKDESISKIEKASKHLLGIINQILDISKIEAEQFKLDSRAFEFEKMIDEIESVLSVSIEEKHLSFEVNLDKAIPRFIISDEIRLAQVFTNLLTNAVKFTPEGGNITLTVKYEVSDNDDDNIMRIEVADTGIGIPSEQIPHLFGDFVQAESDSARKFGGTGLGLSISKRIVEMMGGSIWGESQPGKGSRFTFTIPVRADDLSDKASNDTFSDEKPQDLEPGYYKGCTILLAEDMEVNREIVVALLEPTGIEIECALDGAQAIQMMRDDPKRYDLIFMDVQMPGIDGITATRVIRELGTESSKSIPIVAMTANVFQEDIDACLKAGMNDHLSKPLDLAQIMAKLRMYL